VDGEAEGAGVDEVISHVEDPAPRERFAPDHAPQPVAERDRLVPDPDPVEDAEADGLDDEARAHGLRRREALEKPDPVPGRGKQGGGGETADPGACNGNVEGRCQGRKSAGVRAG